MTGSRLLLLLSSLAGLSACGADPPFDTPAPSRRTTALSSTPSSPSTPVPCMLTKLPGMDPQKPKTGICSRPPLQPVPAATAAKLQQYLAEWAKQAPTWKSLSAADQEEHRRRLKASIVANGGQP